MKISVNCPSYKRPSAAGTLDYLPYCRVWVDESEAEEYRSNYPGAEVIACPKGVQGFGPSRIRNYILDEEFKRGMDAVCIVDDDLSALRRYEYDPGANFGYVPHVLTPDEVLVFLEKYTLMAQDIGAKMWGVNVYFDPMAYRHNTPFSTRSVVLGPFSVHLKGTRCRYDERLPLKEDYDMTLQQLNLERVVLRVNAYHYLCKQSENAGGCAAIRNREKEKEQLELLQQKWGSRIVKVDESNKGRSNKVKRLDYNPIIRVPIKGV